MTDLRSSGFERPCLSRRGYEVSGFVFETGEPFPELAETAAPPVSRFRLRLSAPVPTDTVWYHYARLADGRAWPAFGKSPSDACYVIDFAGVCAFVISERGGRIDGRPAAGTAASTVRRLFLDQVIPLVLNLRGYECLHASAVLVGGAACAFIGPSGAGKSTLAAALASPARPLLSDDCLALADSQDGLVAYSGNRGSKLWPDSAEALCGDHGSLPAVTGHEAKKLLESEAVPPRCAPLSRIYLLDPGPRDAAPSLGEAHPSQGVPILLEAAFRLDLTDADMLARQFRFLMSVVSAVPLRRVRYSHDFAALPTVCDLILADAEAG
ncbi:MAG TPA: hypothetical protein VN428_11330 [Bryobacteraceae bacterium]|nr:hypothetical protein [Bryobacteraceae bacterium]